MTKDKRIALYLLTHGSWKVRAALALTAVGILVLDPVVETIRGLAERTEALVHTVCERLADAVADEVKELAARYKAGSE